MSLIDIHCHPSLKIFLFDTHLAKDAHPHNLNISAKMFVNLPAMQTGGVNAVNAVHYLPEQGLIKDVKKRRSLRMVVNLSKKVCGEFVESKFEDLSGPTAPFDQLIHMIQLFENNVAEANNPPYNFKTKVAKSFTEFNRLVNEGYVVFLHSIEGAHALGHNIDYQTCENEVVQLFEAGVCQFTIAHFFENILVSSQGGIPPKIKKGIDFTPDNTYPKGYNETDHLAERLIAKMLDLGIIVDLVHCTPGAKEMVYRINDSRDAAKRPLVFSHTGLREIALKYNPGMDPADLEYFPDATDVKKIQDCGGVLGILFMHYWLDGFENNEPGIKVVVETIQAIKDICKNYDHISIGTDLDGFTEVPKDLAGVEYMPGLVAEMRSQAISQDDIDKICFGNYMRVLEKGWGKK